MCFLCRSASLFKNLIYSSSFFFFFRCTISSSSHPYLSFIQESMEMLAATLGRVQELFSDDYSPKSANMMNVIFHYLPCYQFVLCNIYGFIMNHSPYWLVVKISIFMIFRTCQCWHRSLLNLWSGCYSINTHKI